MMNVDQVTLSPEDITDGYSAEEIFSTNECVGITFDDLITLPGILWDEFMHQLSIYRIFTKTCNCAGSHLQLNLFLNHMQNNKNT